MKHISAQRPLANLYQAACIKMRSLHTKSSFNSATSTRRNMRAGVAQVITANCKLKNTWHLCNWDLYATTILLSFEYRVALYCDLLGFLSNATMKTIVSP
jgi:hypothetical protein